MTAPADALASIAELIRAGLPTPIGIVISQSSGRVTIQPDADDLGPWITLLEVDWPTWDVVDGYAHAVWPDGTFAGKPFVVQACRAVALSVVSSS
jgi:hypothetical protein